MSEEKEIPKGEMDRRLAYLDEMWSRARGLMREYHEEMRELGMRKDALAKRLAVIQFECPHLGVEYIDSGCAEAESYSRCSVCDGEVRR